MPISVNLPLSARKSSHFDNPIRSSSGIALTLDTKTAGTVRSLKSAFVIKHTVFAVFPHAQIQTGY